MAILVFLIIAIFNISIAKSNEAETMKNSTNLKENLQDFIEERLNESYTNIAHTKEYKEISSKHFEAFKKLKDELKNNTAVLEKYEEAEADLYYMQLKQAYLTGVKDSNIIFNNLIILE